MPTKPSTPRLAGEAGRRGWKRAEVAADHLAIRTRPDRVADAIASLLDAEPGVG
jgi:hypothetical protein